MGRGQTANVFYNGHGHLGWTLSAVTADMVANVVKDAMPGRASLAVPDRSFPVNRPEAPSEFNLLHLFLNKTP